MANLRDIRREAVMRAEVLLADLDVGPTERVRVFDVIEDDGVWLTFEPLERLYGWYQRVEDAAGVVVNASHPTPLQRFTAAHELGHHLLGHEQSLDDERSIIDGGRGSDPQEVAAHTFAANLLMPLAAVEFHLVRLGLDRDYPQATPVDVYRLSVELGVSYSAAAVQLASLNKVPWNAVPRLRRVRPLVIKRELGGGRTPDYARAAVWTLDARDDGRHLLLDVGDELHVTLGEVRSSGYRWMARRTTLDAFAVVSDELHTASDERRYGARQGRRIVFKATTPGAHSIVIDLRRPWDDEGEPARRFGVAVDVEAPRISEVGRGVSINQQHQLVAA